ncbi:MAG: acyl dehydratase [Frankiales bacterium]|nr:acyl dehydratase [Frankiales bacterium]
MAISPSIVGTSTPPVTMTVERGRLQLFAKAIGQSDPLYVDVAAARAAGHPDLPVPPTFLFGLELERPNPFAWIEELGVDMPSVLHGSQSFDYTTMAYAGDVLTAVSTITDVYDKKGGALEFLDRVTHITRDGDPIATLTQTTVVRNS